MSFTLFSVIIILLFSVICLIEIFRGKKRILEKNLISLGALVTGVLMSITFSPVLAKWIAEPIFDEISKQAFYVNLVGSGIAINLFVKICVCIVLSAVLFIPLVFILRKLLFAIANGILKKALHGERQSRSFSAEASWVERNENVLSTVVSFISAVVVTMVITSPIMGTVDIVHSAASLAKRGDPGVFADMGIPEDQVKRVEEYVYDIPGNVFYRLGGKGMFTSVAKTDVSGEYVHVFSEVEQFGGAMENFISLVPLMRGKVEFAEKHLQSIDALCERVEEMNAGILLIAEFLPQIAETWEEGRTFFKIPMPNVDPNVQPLLNMLVHKMQSTDLQTVKQDTVTLLRIYALMLQCELPAADDGARMLAAIEDSHIIEDLRNEFSKNPNMHDLYREVPSIAVKFVKEYIDKQEEIRPVEYETFIQNIATSILTVNNRGYGTEEERVDTLCIYLQQHSKNLDLGGFSMSETVARYTAELLLAGVLETDTSVEAIARRVKNIL